MQVFTLINNLTIPEEYITLPDDSLEIYTYTVFNKDTVYMTFVKGSENHLKKTLSLRLVMVDKTNYNTIRILGDMTFTENTPYTYGYVMSLFDNKGDLTSDGITWGKSLPMSIGGTIGDYIN